MSRLVHDIPAAGAVPYPVNLPRPQYPFDDAIPCDSFARHLERDFKVLAANWEANRRLATRTNYTNYFTYSDDFTNAAWVKTTVTLTSFLPGVQGALSATRVTPSSADSYILQNFVPAGPVPYVFSGWVWTTGTPFAITLFLVRASDSASPANITINVTATPQRFALVGTPLDTTAHHFSFGGFFAWATGNECFIEGFQLEARLSAGPYIITTSAARVVSVPDCDGLANPLAVDADLLAFLTGESAPTAALGNMRAFTRTYSRVPAPQSKPISKFIDRPLMHGIKSGSAYAVCFDQTVAKKYTHVFSARKSVTRVSSMAPVATTAALPGTNITFVEGAHTLNLAANSSAAATISAFNATLTGLSGVNASASTGSLVIVWTGAMASITTPAGVTVASYTPGGVSFQSTATQTTPATTTFTATAHGAVVGDRVALWAGDALVGTGQVVSVGDANNFTMMTAQLDAADTLVTHCAFSSDAAVCYAVGAIEADCEEVTTFYLLGYSPNGAVTVSLPTDIPLVTVQMDPISWLAALEAYRAAPASTTYAIESSQGKSPYRGQIIGYTYTRVQLADVYDTVTP